MANIKEFVLSARASPAAVGSSEEEQSPATKGRKSSACGSSAKQDGEIVGKQKKGCRRKQHKGRMSFEGRSSALKKEGRSSARGGGKSSARGSSKKATTEEQSPATGSSAELAIVPASFAADAHADVAHEDAELKKDLVIGGADAEFDEDARACQALLKDYDGAWVGLCIGACRGR